MGTVHTHYENLKVLRNAPVEVIRAAYRVLAQKHHPDVNPSPDAARVMKLLNEAWHVLGDPALRAEHDKVIARQEAIEEALEEALREVQRPTSPPRRTDNQYHAPPPAGAATNGSPAQGWKSAATRPPAPAPANPLMRLNDWLGTSAGIACASATLAAVALGVWLWSANSDKRKSSVSYSSPTPQEDYEARVAARTAQPTAPLQVVGDKASDRVRVRDTNSEAAAGPNAAQGPPKLFADASTPGQVRLAKALSSPPKIKKQWVEVAAMPEYQKLAEDDKEAVRQNYFERVIAPRIEATNLLETREAFASYSGSLRQDKWAPNGRPWPATAAYLVGLPRRMANGLTSITIDNASGGFDAYVKLCPVAPGRCDGFRHAYVPNSTSFTLESVTPGEYEIRYQDIATRRSARSAAIQLRQTATETGTRYSSVRLTIFPVRDGKMHFSSLSPEEF